jgi:hypothetical protein
VHRSIDGLLLSLLVLTACGDDGGSETSTDSTEDSSSDTGASGTDTITTFDTDEVGTSETTDTGEATGTGECGGQSPGLLCDTMLAFYEDARTLNESQETDCQLLSIFGRGVGPDGILLDDVFAIEPMWIVSYVCPGRRIEYSYSASAAAYPLVTEYTEDVDPSDFKQIESAIVDSPTMMEIHAGTNCPDILTVDQPRFVFQPSGIGQSTAVYEIGETLGGRALITVDAQGEIVEILPCQ